LQNILKDGGKELQLPKGYQDYLGQIPVYISPISARTKLGARIFYALWGPVFHELEVLTKRSLQKDGNVPRIVALLVRTVMLIMWVVHDFFFAPLFGRGDGLEEKTYADEYAPDFGETSVSSQQRKAVDSI
jgi:hypothetical protein